MKVPGRKRLVAAYRWIRSRIRNRALILGYHRIASSDSDPFRLCVAPETFRRHLEELRRFSKPVSLSRLVAGLDAGEVEPGSVALTFDDAYLETLHVVEPILAEYSIPATVFVTTSTLGQEFWWDRLYRACVAPGSPHEPGTGPGSMQSQARLFMDLYRRLLVGSEEDREDALEQLENEAGEKGAVSPESRVVSGEELADLARSPHIDIGSHTVSHPMMAMLSRKEQELEVGPSRSFLEDLLGQDVSLFSYPNGSCTRISEEVVREAGFAGACGSLNDVVLANSNRYQLPRFWPSDQPAALARPLELWLGR